MFRQLLPEASRAGLLGLLLSRACCETTPVISLVGLSQALVGIIREEIPTNCEADLLSRDAQASEGTG